MGFCLVKTAGKKIKYTHAHRSICHTATNTPRQHHQSEMGIFLPTTVTHRSPMLYDIHFTRTGANALTSHHALSISPLLLQLDNAVPHCDYTARAH